MKQIKPKRINHKFCCITDVCLICGVQKRFAPYAGNGFNVAAPRFNIEYSKDGISFSKQFINCTKKQK